MQSELAACHISGRARRPRHPQHGASRRALRLRWLWLAWMDPARPWAQLELPCDDKDRALFASETRVTVGDDSIALFWHYSWLGEQPLRQVYPNLFRRSIRKNRTVAEAIRDDRWITDLRRDNSLEIIRQVVLLQRRIREANLALHGGTEDKITWKAGGDYTARSAYLSQLPSQPTSAMKSLVWMIWAPGKIKFFLWLLHQNRLWCNDRLQRRGWENSYFCQLCLRNLESSSHLFWDCPIAI